VKLTNRLTNREYQTVIGKLGSGLVVFDPEPCDARSLARHKFYEERLTMHCQQMVRAQILDEMAEEHETSTS